jgi:beta-lactamase class A
MISKVSTSLNYFLNSLRRLCAFAPLRETVLACLLLMVSSVRAEDELVGPVVEKVRGRLEKIAAGVDGVLGIVVEDLEGEHRFAVNAGREFAQASAIKIPILMEVFEQADEGEIDLDERVWVEKKYQVAGSGILGELGDHSTQMSVRDLCVLMIMLSDNTATNMLIDKVGLENVTKTMASLGCESTKLRRRMMDTDASARGDENVSTPADAAKLLRLLYEGKLVSHKVSKDVLDILRKEKPGDVKSALPAGIRVAFKAGSIPGVATEWAIVELENRPYIVVVMGAYGKGDEFKEAIRDVSQVAYDFFSRLATATKYGAYIDPEEWKKH